MRIRCGGIVIGASATAILTQREVVKSLDVMVVKRSNKRIKGKAVPSWQTERKGMGLLYMALWGAIAKDMGPNVYVQVSSV